MFPKSRPAFRLAHLVPRAFVLPVLAVSVFIIQFGISLSEVPTIQLSQNIICSSYYSKLAAASLIADNGPATTPLVDISTQIGSSNITLPGAIPFPIPEDLLHEACLVEPVQRELNLVATGLLVSQTLGGALAALPVGIFADRIGRIPAFALCIFGILVSQAYILGICRSASPHITITADNTVSEHHVVSIRAIWGAGAFLIIGGGRYIAEALVFTIVSDISTEKRRAMYFQFIACAVLLAQLAAQPVVNAVMPGSVYLPLYISLGTIAFGALLAITLVPETVGWGNKTTEGGPHPPVSSTSRTPSTTKTSFIQEARNAITSTMRALNTAIRNRHVALLLPGTVLSIPLASSQMEALVRLMPIQFSWSLGLSAILLAVRAGVTVLVLGAILPLLGLALSRRNHRRFAQPHDQETTPNHPLNMAAWTASATSTLADNLLLARGSGVFLILGAVLVMLVMDANAVISGVVVSSLGSGVPTLCRALIVGLVKRQQLLQNPPASSTSTTPSTCDEMHVGGLFGGLAILETLSFLIFYAVVGALFDAGLASWLGLPFVPALAVAVGIVACLWFVRVAPSPQEQQQHAVSGASADASASSAPLSPVASFALASNSSDVALAPVSTRSRSSASSRSAATKADRKREKQRKRQLEQQSALKGVRIEKGQVVSG